MPIKRITNVKVTVQIFATYQGEDLPDRFKKYTVETTSERVCDLSETDDPILLAANMGGAVARDACDKMDRLVLVTKED